MSHPEFDLRRAWLDDAYAGDLDPTALASLPSSPVPAPRSPETVQRTSPVLSFTFYSRRPCCG